MVFLLSRCCIICIMFVIEFKQAIEVSFITLCDLNNEL